MQEPRTTSIVHTLHNHLHADAECAATLSLPSISRQRRQDLSFPAGSGGVANLPPASSEEKWGSDLPREMLRWGLLKPGAGPESLRLWLGCWAACAKGVLPGL